MLRFNNLSIGTKLALTSGLGVLLVLAMIGALFMGDSGVRNATDSANRQQGVAFDTAMLKAALRGMQIGARDIRLAATTADLKKAEDYLDERLKSASGLVDTLLQTLRLPENRERATKIRDVLGQYNSDVRELSALRAKIVTLIAQSDASPSPEAAAQIKDMNLQATAIVRDRTLPKAAELDRLATEIADSAQNLAKANVHSAEDEMQSVERINAGIGIAVVAVLIGAVLLSLVTIARPIRRLIDVLAQIDKGNTKVEVQGTERADEVGSLAKAVVLIRAARDADLANSRVRTGLDVVRSNVMLADEHYNIIYMNNSLQEMMKSAEADLRKVLPNFDSSRLIGANMDVFHKNPAHQRRMLDALTGTHETRIAVGTQKFHLVATAVYDKDKKRAGTVVEWRNETAEKAIEAEIDDVVKAAAAGDFSKRVPVEGKKEFMLALATAMNNVCETVGGALDELLRVIEALAKGDLTRRISGPVRRRFRQAQGRYQCDGGSAWRDHRRDQARGAGSDQCLGGDRNQHHGPVAAHRGAGRQPGTDLGFHGGNLLHREKERRERAGRQSVGRHHPRGRRSRRAGGGPGRQRHGQDRGFVA